MMIRMKGGFFGEAPIVFVGILITVFLLFLVIITTSMGQLEENEQIAREAVKTWSTYQLPPGGIEIQLEHQAPDTMSKKPFTIPQSSKAWISTDVNIVIELPKGVKLPSALKDAYGAGLTATGNQLVLIRQ